MILSIISSVPYVQTNHSPMQFKHTISILLHTWNHIKLFHIKKISYSSNVRKIIFMKNCFPDFYVFDSKKCRSSHTDFIYLRRKMANKRIYWAKMNLPQKLIRTHTWFLLVTAASKRSLCGRGKVCFSSVGELLQNNEHNHNIAHQTLASLLIHT